MKIRILWHILFWAIFSATYAVLNTAFPNPSDLEFSLPIRFLRFWGNEWLMLPHKWLATYGLIYWVVPRYLLKGDYVKGTAYFLLILIPAIILNRLTTYYAVFPFLYGEYPSYELVSLRRFLFGFLDIATAIGAFSTIKLLKGRISDQRNKQALIQEKLQSELNFLRAQTNPHFLFNTLNNIYALARKQSPQTAPVVMKLSQMLRFMLYECTKPEIPLQEEIKVIEDYIELEKLRYNDRLDVTFDIHLDNPNQQIAPLLILPLVENAFKHGASESRFETWIHISIHLEQGLLTLMIENSKEDVDTVSGVGIGLANVKRQLELIYKNNYDLNIQDLADRYHVSLIIHL